MNSRQGPADGGTEWDRPGRENRSRGSHQPSADDGSSTDRIRLGLENEEEEPNGSPVDDGTLLAEKGEPEPENNGRRPRYPLDEGNFEQDGEYPTETQVAEGARRLDSAVQASESVNLVAVGSLNCTEQWPARFAEGKANIHFDSRDVWSFSNQIKGSIEDFIGVPVNWWPLSAREKALPDGFSRVRWTCVSGYNIVNCSECPTYWFNAALWKSVRYYARGL